MSGMVPGSDDFEDEYSKVMDPMMKYIYREAEYDLPMLEDALGPEASKLACQQYVDTKKFAPPL